MTNLRGDIPPTDETLAAAIEEYLGECFENRSAARVSELANRLGIRRVVLYAQCRRLFNATPLQLLRARQLAWAADLLERPEDITTAQIAQRAAFGTEATFFRTFAKRYGCTPEEYRRRSRSRLSAERETK